MSEIISILVGACELADKGRGIVAKFIKKFLSPIQKELLQAAARSGNFYVIEIDQIAYPIIRAGGTDMGKASDPASLATYYEALKSLCSNGYVEHAGGVFFRLTTAGFNKARKFT